MLRAVLVGALVLAGCKTVFPEEQKPQWIQAQPLPATRGQAGYYVYADGRVPRVAVDFDKFRNIEQVKLSPMIRAISQHGTEIWVAPFVLTYNGGAELTDIASIMVSPFSRGPALDRFSDLVILVDGQRMQTLAKPEYTLSTAESGGASEIVTALVPLTAFEVLGRARRIDIALGIHEVALTPVDIAAFAELAQVARQRRAAQGGRQAPAGFGQQH